MNREEFKMADSNNKEPSQLARMVLQHLQSLSGSGIEWLPLAREIPSPEPIETAEASAAPPSILSPDIATEGAQLQMEESASTDTPRQSIEERGHALQMWAEKVSKCSRCPELYSSRTQTVFGVGKIDPELCFIGEAPGADEDAKGEPFVGAAGKLLNRIIIACGMQREEVYICNIIKCRPPGNRAPLPSEAANCREYLEHQLDLVKPKYICALGATAVQYLLGTKQSIGRLRGQFQHYKGIPVLATYHPAYLLRSPEKKADVWEDMKKLMARMGRAIPTNNKERS
jgi:uracil-DNA glycosylase family 4